NFSKAPGTYNEPEGIFPDGLYTTVEGDRQCEWLGGERGHGNIDIWKLRLDGTGKDFTRLTHFNDYEGGKASNPVISIDGRCMAFQVGRTGDPAGGAYVILIYCLKKEASGRRTFRRFAGTCRQPRIHLSAFRSAAIAGVLYSEAHTFVIARHNFQLGICVTGV